MRVLIQRVQKADITINNDSKRSIGKGMVVLVGIESEDTMEDIDWLVKKTSQLRIFDDALGVMNLSLIDIGGEAMIVSQFTLHASTKKGNRPSYLLAAPPSIAIPLYETFVNQMSSLLQGKITTGEFGADMQIALINDGPVTIWIDSKNRI